MKLFATRKRKILLATGLVLLGIGAALVSAAVSWANQPVVEPIHQQGSAADTSPLPQSLPVQTSFFTTQVPGGYRLQVAVSPQNKNNVQALAFNNTDPHMQIAIATDLLPSDGLRGIADYNLRFTTRSTYQPFTNSAFPEGSKAYKKTTGSPELALYFIHNNRYASIVVTGTASEEQLLTLLTSVETNWVWQ